MSEVEVKTIPDSQSPLLEDNRDRNTGENEITQSTGFSNAGASTSDFIRSRRVSNIAFSPESTTCTEGDNNSTVTCSSTFSGEMGDSNRQLPAFTPHLRDKMRRRLRYFFMNPIEKYRAKGRCPWKLGLQLIKILFVTFQLILFGIDSSKFQQQQFDAVVALRHLFLKGWDSVREVTSYPPSTGPYAIYTKPEFFAHLDNAIQVYSNITKNPIASLGYDNPNGTITPITFCKTFYRRGKVFPHNATLIFDNTPIEKCFDIDYPEDDIAWKKFSLYNFLQAHNATISFNRLIDAKLTFYLKAVFVKSLTRFDSPDCYRYSVVINYDNSRHDGQVSISLEVDSDKLLCHVNVEYAETDKIVYIFRQILNAVVVILCTSSIFLCGRSLWNAQQLRKITVQFFRKQYGRKLSLQDQFEFLDLWYVMMIANDILILIGSAIKIQLEQRSVEGDQYNTCSIFLGSGNLLVWIGVLRYLGFFRKYNILILTMKRALPNVMRFVLCTLLIYCGFCFCGWVVFGPYHIKFRELSTTSECLFAMMNGDDLFATFAILNTESDLVWWFSRLYLYLFISLFIYVVISLFISVIMDSYETIKEYYETGFPLSDLQSFIAECTEDVSSGAFRQELEDNVFNFLCCGVNCYGLSDCCRNRHNSEFQRI